MNLVLCVLVYEVFVVVKTIFRRLVEIRKVFLEVFCIVVFGVDVKVVKVGVLSELFVFILMNVMSEEFNEILFLKVVR